MACVVRRKDSKYWYGRYRIDGREYVKNLHVEVRGNPPGIDQEHGSVHFEKSKSEAEQVLQKLLREVESSKSVEQLAQAVHQARTGGRMVKTYLISDIPDIWENIPRKRKPSERYKKQCLSTLETFVEYVRTHFTTLEKLDHFSSDQAAQYLKFQEDRGISPKTYNDILIVLQSTFRRAGSHIFDDFKTKTVDTVYRKPYSPEELQAILDASRSDQFIRPIIITAACTAMRRGDCCLLKWDDVDLEDGCITVKTSKTGAIVDIPMFPMLYDEIAPRVGNKSKYVFPEQATQYKSNPDMLTDRLRKVMTLAGFHDGNSQGIIQTDEFDPKELAAKAKSYIETIKAERKRECIQRVFDIYSSGVKLSETAERAGVSKATASGYLNELEKKTGIAFIRGKARSAKSQLPPKRGDVSVEREIGMRRASIRDFHSFRTTWITIALSGGIPFELVQKVTGHTTASIVMKHYFKPHRAQIKKALQTSMPQLLTSGAVTPNEHAAKVLRSANSDNWQNVIKEALLILQG